MQEGSQGISAVATPPTVVHRVVAAITRLMWLAFLASVVIYAWAWLWPDGGGDRQGLFLLLAYQRFMLRTFWLHAGLGWLACAVVALVLASIERGGRAARNTDIRASAPRVGLSAARLVIVSFAMSIAALCPAALRFTKPAPPTTEALTADRHDDLRVMTVNLLIWNRAAGMVKTQIDRYQPDVVVFQEYTPGMADELRPVLAPEFPHIEESPQRDSFGQAVYSKLPFVGKPEIYPQVDYLISHGKEPRYAGLIGSGDPQIRVVVRIGGTRQKSGGPASDGTEVVIQNVHLSTPYLKSTYNEQRSMVRWLADWAASERRPLIITGDFNNTPYSIEAGLLRDVGLVEVHASVGRGLGDTWPKSNYWRRIPGIRLDQIWVRGLAPTWSGTGESMCSDHVASAAGFAWPNP